MTKIKPLSPGGISTCSLQDRPSKVSHRDFGRAWEPSGSFMEFVRRLPRLLAGETLREVAAAWVKARRDGRQVLLGMGAHPLKVGLSPVILDLMRRRLITGLAMNGAGIVHDAEIAMVGRTSEDVDQVLGQGQFGMARETAELLNAAIANGAPRRSRDFIHSGAHEEYQASAFRHSELGLRMITVSSMESGAGSVEVSALRAFPSTV